MTPTRSTFVGADIELAGEVLGDPGARPVLLLHGGGQTRHSWSSAVVELARRGYYAISIDMRGHGDSGWSRDGDYRMTRFRDDVLSLIAQQAVPPVLVGASLGGIAALLAIGEAETNTAGLVLVDITPRVELSGVGRIQAFMTANLDGFASLDEVVDAVAAYNPHRPRPRNGEGLLKNLRLRDGRYYWHWDPALMAQPDVLQPEYFDRLDAAAARISVPTLLIKGAESEIVSAETVAHMRALIPHAEFVDISGAGHMVAGDRNDAFNSAVFDFLDHHSLVSVGPHAGV